MHASIVLASFPQHCGLGMRLGSGVCFVCMGVIYCFPSTILSAMYNVYYIWRIRRCVQDAVSQIVIVSTVCVCVCVGGVGVGVGGGVWVGVACIWRWDE